MLQAVCSSVCYIGYVKPLNIIIIIIIFICLEKVHVQYNNEQVDISNVRAWWKLHYSCPSKCNIYIQSGAKKRGQWAILSNCKYSENSMTEFR